MAETPEKVVDKVPDPAPVAEETPDRKAPRLTSAELSRDAMARFDQPSFVVSAALQDAGIDAEKRLSVVEATKIVTAYLAHEVVVETEA